MDMKPYSVYIKKKYRLDEMKIKRVSDSIARTFKMRISHISDTHGNFPKMNGKYDCVVFSGDFFPTTKAHNYIDKTEEISNQKFWLDKNIENIKRWLNQNPFLFILGNHDFISPDYVEEFLKNNEIEAIDLTGKLIEFNRVAFYGFPWVPEIDGSWNYECSSLQMKQQVDLAFKTIEHNLIEVFVSHGPVHNILDLTYGNEHVGNLFMKNILCKIDYFLCGHIHEAMGLANVDGVLHSNAAMHNHVIEIT